MTLPTPHPPEKVLTLLLGTMTDLKAVYVEEIQAMKISDTRSFMAIQPIKEALSRDYELKVREIQARVTSIKKVDAVLREKVATEQAALTLLADQSQAAAQRMADAMRRLQERLMMAAREAIKQETISYTHQGALGSSAYKARPIATAINEAI